MALGIAWFFRRAVWLAALAVLYRLHKVSSLLLGQSSQAGSDGVTTRLRLVEEALGRVERELTALRSATATATAAAGASPTPSPLLGAVAAAQATPPADAEQVREAVCASRIQRAYRGHRERMAFFQLVAQISAAA